MELSGKTALVTGASAGIGRAAALALAARGANVVLAARREAQLETLAAQINDGPGTATWLAGDVCNPTYAADLVQLAQTRFDGLHMAFNNVGVLGTLGAIPDMSLETWEDVLCTNLTSAMLGLKYQIPAMHKAGGGAILLTSSFVGHTIGMPGMAAYAASKSGLLGLMRVAAVEHGGAGIRVNALLPGGTDTDMARSFADTPEARAGVAGIHALGRMATPQEIARTAVALLTDDTSFVTGAALLADGGVSIYKA